MSGFIETITTSAKNTAVALIKSVQPTYDCYEDPLPQIERIVRYTRESFRCFAYLCERDSKMLGRHAIVMLAAGTTGAISAAFFLSAVSSLFASIVSPCYLLSCSLSLIVSAGSGFFCLQLLRDLDANVRYEAVKHGLRNLAFGRQ